MRADVVCASVRAFVETLHLVCARLAEQSEVRWPDQTTDAYKAHITEEASPLEAWRLVK